MLTKEEEDLIIFDIRFGDIILGDLVREKLNQRICNELFTKLCRSNESIGFAFIILPREFITQEMCDIAFEKDIDLLTEFPGEFITQEMYVSYLNYRKNYSRPYFTHLPKQRMGTISYTQGKCSRKKFSLKNLLQNKFMVLLLKKIFILLDTFQKKFKKEN